LSKKKREETHRLLVTVCGINWGLWDRIDRLTLGILGLLEAFNPMINISVRGADHDVRTAWSDDLKGMFVLLVL